MRLIGSSAQFAAQSVFTQIRISILPSSATVRQKVVSANLSMSSAANERERTRALDGRVSRDETG